MDNCDAHLIIKWIQTCVILLPEKDYDPEKKTSLFDLGVCEPVRGCLITDVMVGIPSNMYTYMYVYTYIYI